MRCNYPKGDGDDHLRFVLYLSTNDNIAHSVTKFHILMVPPSRSQSELPLFPVCSLNLKATR